MLVHVLFDKRKHDDYKNRERQENFSLKTKGAEGEPLTATLESCIYSSCVTRNDDNYL